MYDRVWLEMESPSMPIGPESLVEMFGKSEEFFFLFDRNVSRKAMMSYVACPTSPLKASEATFEVVSGKCEACKVW